MIIYKITNKLDGKVYIGQTIRKLSRRWEEHKRDNDCIALHNAIKKYGENNFKIEEIDGANSLSELNYLEQHYIHIYNSLRPGGYNLISGGGSKGISEETRQKMSAAAKKRMSNPEIKEKRRITMSTRCYKRGPMSEETKLKISKSIRRSGPRKKGRKSWNKGIPMKEETKKKISTSKKGKPRIVPGGKYKKKIKE